MRQENEDNILLIFGAGASFDIANGVEGVPITKKLFTAHNRLFSRALGTEYGQHAQSVIDEVIEKFQSDSKTFDLEGILNSFLDRSERSVNAKQSLLGLRFFMKDLVKSYENRSKERTPNSNSYVRILRKLQQWQETTDLPINLVTFNYDTLLDSACERIFHINLTSARSSGWDSLDTYIENSRIKLYRPHGCIKWVRQADYIGDQLFAEETVRNMDLSLYSINFSRNELEDGQNEIPALALPFKDNKQFEWPDKHRDEFMHSLKGVTKVFLIGWRAAEPHFIKLIKDSINPKARWIIINRSAESGNVVIANLEKLQIKNTFRYDKGFSKFVNSQEFKDELVELERAVQEKQDPRTIEGL